MVLLGGCLTGVVTAHLVVSHSGAPVASEPRAWQSFAEPDGGNPYRAAHYLLARRLPPPPQVLAEIEAETDSDGAGLSGSCTYRVRFRDGGARWWHLSAVAGGRAGTAARNSLDSAAVPSSESGEFDVMVSRSAQPGHWLDPGMSGAYTLILAAAAGSGPPPVPPRIERMGCG